jgi:hypothetical protein
MLGSSRVAAQLAASQEGLSSMSESVFMPAERSTGFSCMTTQSFLLAAYTSTWTYRVRCKTRTVAPV